MNIGVVTTSFPRHAGDYAGCFVGDRVQTLLSEGHSVEVIAAGDGAAGREIARPGLTVTRITAPHPNPLPSRRERGPEGVAAVAVGALFYGAGAPEVLEQGGAAVWFAAGRFTAALAAAVGARARRLDLIESHWLVPSTFAAVAAAPDHRHRAYAHSGDVALLERIPLGRAIARRIARAGVSLCFVSDELQRRFAGLAGVPRTIGVVAPLLPPAVDWVPRAGVDSAGRRRLGLSRPTVLAVGRLVPIKGHDRLLRACAHVQAASRGAAAALEVVILGDGPERARLAQLAEGLGVRLRLPGFVPRAEVARWLRASHVYVQPSIRLANGRGEGAPLATAEARAVGIPVLVASDVVSLAEGLQRSFYGEETGV
jgi:glycosyltransferase involved in cell wall biosynthesis